MKDIEKTIREALEKFWDDRAIPSDDDGVATVDELVGPMESMTAVDVLATLDGIVGFKLPSTVIQVGGYKSRDEFVNKLSARVIAKVNAKAKVKT